MFSCSGKKKGGSLGLALALAGGGGGSSSGSATKPKEGGTGKYPKLEKKIKDTLAFSWDTPSNKKILVSQQDYTDARTFSISGEFLTELKKIASEKKTVQFGYKVTVGTKATEETKVNFEPNKDKFDFAIDNFHSFQVAKGIVKPRVKVTLYIENENIYFKEFDGPYLQGKKGFSFMFKNKEVEHNRFLNTSEKGESLTVTTEGYEFSDLETRLEANLIEINDNQTETFIPTISNPANNLSAQASKVVTLTKQMNAIRGKLFVRAKKSTDPWVSVADTTRYIKFSRTVELVENITYSSPFIRGGEILSIAFRIPQSRSGQIQNVLFSMFSKIDAYRVFSYLGGNGSYNWGTNSKSQSFYEKYININFKSSTLKADGKIDDGLKAEKDYTIEWKMKTPPSGGQRFSSLQISLMLDSGGRLDTTYFIRIE